MPVDSDHRRRRFQTEAALPTAPWRRWEDSGAGELALSRAASSDILSIGSGALVLLHPPPTLGL